MPLKYLHTLSFLLLAFPELVCGDGLRRPKSFVLQDEGEVNFGVDNGFRNGALSNFENTQSRQRAMQDSSLEYCRPPNGEFDILDQVLNTNTSDVSQFLVDGTNAIPELAEFMEAVRSKLDDYVSDSTILDVMTGPTIIISNRTDVDTRRELLEWSDECEDAMIVLFVDIVFLILAFVGLPRSAATRIVAQALVRKALQRSGSGALANLYVTVIDLGEVLNIGAYTKIMTEGLALLAANVGVKEILVDALENLTFWGRILLGGSIIVELVALFTPAGYLNLIKTVSRLFAGASVGSSAIDAKRKCQEKPSSTPSITPSLEPSFSPTEFDHQAEFDAAAACLLNPCCQNVLNCDRAGEFGDPNIRTFDNLRYAFQGKGEYVLFSSASIGAQVQGRFEKSGERVSVATGFAATAGSFGPSVEISIDPTDNAKVLVLVDRFIVAVSDNLYVDQYTVVTVSNDVYTVFFKASKMSIIARYRRSSFRHFDIEVRLPPSFPRTDVVGLYGSPDGNPTNEWVAANGTTLPIDLSGEAIYAYGTTEWCIRQVSQSLFSYTEENDFGFYSGCDDPYPGVVDTSTASQELRELCGADEACLVEGIEFGLEAAQQLLETEVELGGSSINTSFRAAPSNVTVGIAANIALTVNLTASSEADISNIEEFAVYGFNGQTFERNSTFTVTLRDVGSGVGEDTFAGDKIFSNLLAVSANFAGQEYSFQAVPRIAGSLVFGSPFVFTALNAVQGYSQQSGIGGIVVDTENFWQVGSVDGLQLVIQYSWPLDQRDLDSGTSFLNRKVGYGCVGGGQHMSYSGDNTGAGGTETARIDLGQSFEENEWTDQIPVELHAHWYSNRGSGPATVTVFTEKELPDGSVAAGPRTFSFPINPTSATGCSSRLVGTVIVSTESNEEITIRVDPQV
ncbi:unnamed protein product [Cylindrotheca closterium]|uniref:VWFD domain-containing protein n=1 Tax=Cylindrotheca closterium TaxID=2856 RepID=A0AAD2G263_9STRA|nr:unnamed protein product [Cylindrotheca closterium]